MMEETYTARPMRCVAVSNLKGGCGKTTTALNLAVALSRRDRRVLLIDMDPQGHATLGLGFQPERFPVTHSRALFHPEIPLKTGIVPTGIPGLDLLPSTLLLAETELEADRLLGKQWLLREQLADLRGRYDLVVLDCSPSLGLLTLNALIASTHVVIPVQAHYYALQGLQRCLDTLGVLKRRYRPCPTTLMGILLTFVDDRTVLSRRIQAGLRKAFGSQVFDTVIHSSVRLAESPSHGRPLLWTDPESRSAREYQRLGQEVLGRLVDTTQSVSQSA